MPKRYEVRVRENNNISRKYVSNIKNLSALLRDLQAIDVVGVYKLKFSNDEVVGSDKLSWEFKGNSLSLRTLKENKILSPDIIPLTQGQMDLITKKVKDWEDLFTKIFTKEKDKQSKSKTPAEGTATAPLFRKPSPAQQFSRASNRPSRSFSGNPVRTGKTKLDPTISARNKRRG